MASPLNTPNETEECSPNEIKKERKPFKIPKYTRSPKVTRSYQKKNLKIPAKIKWKPPKFIYNERNNNIESSIPITEHQSNPYQNTGNYKCYLCHKVFRDGFNLRVHLRKHTNERPFKCNKCNKAYKHKKDLRIHLKNSH
eukprot:484981_1